MRRYLSNRQLGRQHRTELDTCEPSTPQAFFRAIQQLLFLFQLASPDDLARLAALCQAVSKAGPASYLALSSSRGT